MQRFDRIVLGVAVGLVLIIGAMLVIGDTVGVGVSRMDPDPDSQPAVTTPISATFTEPMETDTVEERFAIDPAVGGTLSWQGNTIIFEPDVAFQPQQTYRVQIEPGARTKSGRTMRNPVSWSFTPRQLTILYLYPANAELRELWAIPPGGEPEERFTSEFGIFDFAPAPDGSWIAVTVYNQNMTTDLLLIDRNGNEPRRLTDCSPAICGSPAWSPDGNLLAYERRSEPLNGQQGPSRVWLYDLETDETAPVFEDNQVLGFAPVFSPDGRRLAFFDANQGAIRVVDLQSGQATLVPSQMGEVGSFAPDGSAMAFVDIRPVGRQYFTQIWLAMLEGQEGLVPLDDDAEEDRVPAWSPDGKWIVFGRRRIDRQTGFGSQAMLYSTLSEEITTLTEDPYYNNTHFSWSPTGRRLLIQRFNLAETYTSIEIWVYDLEEETLTLLSENGFGAEWLP